MRAADGKTRESRGARYPLATLSAAYMRLGPVQEFTIPIGPKSYTMQMGVENSYSAGVGLQYQLFNWGRTGTQDTEMYLILLPEDWPARLPGQ